jgi:hypothetical protein
MATLPVPFTDLADGLEWALPTERQRFTKRLTSMQEDLVGYYQLIEPHMSAIVEYLAGYDLGDELPEEVETLYFMALSFMEVSISVERFREPDESGVFPASRYIVKGPEDLVVGYMPST